MSRMWMLIGLNGCVLFFFFQAEDGIRDLVRSRGLGDVYKRQEHPGYKVKVGMPYWFFNGKYVKHEVTEALYYREIEEYVKEGMIYVEDEGGTVSI